MAKEELKKELKATSLVEMKLGTRLVKVGDNYLTGDVTVTEEMAAIINVELAKPVKQIINLGNTKISINGNDYTGIFESDDAALFAEISWRKSMADANVDRANNKTGYVMKGQIRDSSSANIAHINGSRYVKHGE